MEPQNCGEEIQIDFIGIRNNEKFAVQSVCSNCSRQKEPVTGSQDLQEYQP